MPRAITTTTATRMAAGISLGALGGFATSLLRRRPATSYASSLRQPIAADDSSAEKPD